MGTILEILEVFWNHKLNCFEIFQFIHGLLLWLQKKNKTKIFMNGSQESLDKFQMVIHCSVLVPGSLIYFLRFRSMNNYGIDRLKYEFFQESTNQANWGHSSQKTHPSLDRTKYFRKLKKKPKKMRFIQKFT